MKLIFVDFEMNPISKERRQIRKICPGEIIEIGAVKLDEQAQEISSFKEYVLPKYATEMDETCQELTGITMDMLRQADTFVPAFRRFLDWCNETGENDYEMYAWSENDWRQLHNEMRLKKSIPSRTVWHGCWGTGRIFSRYTAICWDWIMSFLWTRQSRRRGNPLTVRCMTHCGMPAIQPNYICCPKRKRNFAKSWIPSSR